MRAHGIEHNRSIVRRDRPPVCGVAAAGELSGIVPEISAACEEIKAMKILERSVAIADVRRLLRQAPVVALLGPRQAGKTTLARQIAASHRGTTTAFDLEDLARPRAAQRPDAGARAAPRRADDAEGARISSSRSACWRIDVPSRVAFWPLAAQLRAAPAERGIARGRMAFHELAADSRRGRRRAAAATLAPRRIPMRHPRQNRSDQHGLAADFVHVPRTRLSAASPGQVSGGTPYIFIRWRARP